ncbi:MAG: hypothetical protein HND47_13940 [Chloroflexi bacterium]|nr:hypothetical protein [Chloroflexota bacterium]
MRAGRILVALMLAAGLIGVFVNGAPLYSRFLFLGILMLVVSSGVDALGGIGLEHGAKFA